MAEPFMPTCDLELHQAGSDSRHNSHLGREKGFASGKVAVLVRANGALTDGAFCGITGTATDVQELTTAIVTALTDTAAGQMRCGFVQADAADNDYVWMLVVKPDGADTDGNALSGAAITAGAQVYTTTTGGEISGTAGANHRINGVEVTTDPASAIEFTTFECHNPTVDISTNAVYTQTYSTANRTVANPTGVAVTDSGTGTDGGAVAAGTGRYILSIPVTLANVSAADVLTAQPINHRFRLVSMDALVTTAVTTGSKLASLNLEIGTTDVTGGVVALTSANCTPLGARVAGTAITALNIGAAAATLSVEAASVTAFSEGAVVLLIEVQNMDTADAFAAVVAEITNLIADDLDNRQSITALVDDLQAEATFS